MNKKQLTIGAVLSYGAIVFNVISGLLYTPWMIGIIGNEDYALYTLSLSVINIFLLDFGIGSAVTKFLANYYARGQYKEANQFMGIVYKVFIAISLLIAACLFVFYLCIDVIYLKLTEDELFVFKNLFIIVAMYSVCSFPFITYNGILMANERFIEVKICNLGQKIFNVCLIVVFLLMGFGVYALVLINAVSNIIFVVVKYYFIKTKTSLRADLRYWNKQNARGLFDYSIWVTVMNLAHRCIFNIMPTIIASMIGSVEVTIFSLSATLEGYIYTFADAINGMFMSHISKIFVEDNATQKFRSLMIRVGKFHVVTVGLIYIEFICIGKAFVNLWMGDGYELVYWCAIILIFPSLLSVPQQVARTALLAQDYVKEQAFIYIIMAFLNLGLSFILLPKIGIIGAALSICVSYLVRFVGMNILYSKKLPVDLRNYFKSVYLKWCICGCSTAGLGLLIVKKVVVISWITLFLLGGGIGCIYSILIWLFAIDKNMKKAIIKKLKRL